jgi:hypothetical protein
MTPWSAGRRIPGTPRRILCAIQDQEEFQRVRRALDIWQLVGARDARQAWREVSLGGAFDAYVLSYGHADFGARPFGAADGRCHAVAGVCQDSPDANLRGKADAGRRGTVAWCFAGR